MTSKSNTNSRTFLRLAGASLIVATTMVGCSGARMQQRPAIASVQADSIATGIERALAARDFARALLDAERLVEAQPREDVNRTLLGRAYLANGRYASAGTAFEDALTLGANDPRTLISLALVRTATGNAEGARALLSAHIERLPASDYGLAMAMAGDAQEAIRVLLYASHQPEADAQTRQNLAYALALSGQWGQARLVAGQDLAGAQLQERMTKWAASAQPDAYPQRVAGLLGVSPRSDDSGLPERLALSNSEPTSMAAAQPLEPAALAAEAVRDLPAPMPAPALQQAEAESANSIEVAEAAPATADAAFPQPMAAPLIRASADPMRHAVMQRLAEPVIAGKSDAAKALTAPRGLAAIPKSTASANTVHGGSDWVVQIGAFANGKIATAAWTRAHGKMFEQRGYRRIGGTITLNGRTYSRLAMSGFGDRNAAAQLCSALRSQGQSCFVRRDAGVASDIRTARAGKPGQKMAMR